MTFDPFNPLKPTEAWEFQSQMRRSLRHAVVCGEGDVAVAEQEACA